METKLLKIAKLSCVDPHLKFKWLMPLINEEALTGCYNELKGKKAVGTDQVTKEEYGGNLKENIKNLVNKMKTMSYRPRPVKEVLIPKDNGKLRPLGISNFEDKIVQLCFSKILEAIYEPHFYDFSYGFRRGRNCHQAIQGLHKHLSRYTTKVVIDIDLQNYFGTIDHSKLIKLLEMRIEDKTFLRYIVRMLRAGVLSKNELNISDEGTPQGSCVSPILANIFAHYALDEWFDKVVVKYVGKEVKMFRYCDDLVICCETHNDAARIKKSLKKRIERFSLILNEEKSKEVPFSTSDYWYGRKQGTFDFLGFTFYIGFDKKRRTIVRVKTSKKRFCSKLQKVKAWIIKNMHKAKLRQLWKIFVSKLRGHIQYYAVTHNYDKVSSFCMEAVRIFFQWMNRRSQRRSFTWEQFNIFLKQFPLPAIKIHHSLF